MNHKTIYSGGSGEIEEKKSRFIADIAPVKTEEEAQAFIASVKKRYYDARHHCFAYVIGEDGRQMRSSDDGEPQGTAGRPMLDVLVGMGLTDTVAVVTRYFGGTLLGTGGLVRAYAQALQAGLKNCRILEKKKGTKFQICMDYGDLGRLQYYLEQKKIQVLRADYGAKVTIEVIVPETEEKEVLQTVSEQSKGQAGMECLEHLYYAELDNGEIVEKL